MIYVINTCKTCPFHYETDKRRCNIATPQGRPIEAEEALRPSWCPLRKEQVIVREKSS